MNYESVIIGFMALVIIGIFHPIVIKAEYYCSVKIWPLFLILGLLLICGGLVIPNKLIGDIFSIAGFTSLWSIHEVKTQKRRVEKGWFPANPNRRNSTGTQLLRKEPMPEQNKVRLDVPNEETLTAINDVNLM